MLPLKNSISDRRRKELNKNSIIVFHMLNGYQKKKKNCTVYRKRPEVFLCKWVLEELQVVNYCEVVEEGFPELGGELEHLMWVGAWLMLTVN